MTFVLLPSSLKLDVATALSGIILSGRFPLFVKKIPITGMLSSDTFITKAMLRPSFTSIRVLVVMEANET